MELEIIKWIQSFRNPVFDQLFYWITQLGDQIVFIGIVAIIYWTIDKRFAHRFAFAFMMSAVVNTGLKSIFKRIRPYYYPGVSSEEAWRTTGYSFPSGHAQSAGVLGYTIFHASKTTKYKWLKYVAWFIVILVPFSRLYLGQHFLSDVIVGLGIALGLSYLAFKLIDKMGDDEHVYTLMLVPLFIIALFFFRNHDVYIAAGGFIGFAIGYYVEKKYVGYDVKAVWWIQVIKIILGLGIAFGFKEGLKLVFPDEIFFDFLRYLTVGVWAALGAPFIFKYGTKHLRKKV